MHPRGAKRKSDDQATFSKAGPYLRRPDTTRSPSVIPKVYRLNKSSIRAGPKSNKETPKKGEAKSIAGTIPIKVLTKAVAVRAVMISLILRI